IEAHYLKRGASKRRKLHIKPLGLSYQDSNIYLVCIFKGLADGTLASLPLHRFHSAKATWEDLEAPGGFEMNSFEVKRSLISQKTEHPRSEERRVGKERRTRWSEMEDSETA